MKYEFDILPQQLEHYYYFRCQYGEYEIALQFQIYNQTRIHFFLQSKPNVMPVDWCCGRDAYLVFIGILCLVYCVDNDTVDKLPQHSLVRPYDLDDEFFDFVNDRAGKFHPKEKVQAVIVFPWYHMIQYDYKNVQKVLDYSNNEV